MTFKFNCPKCQKSIKATSEVAGRVAKCPGCGSKLRIPTPQPAAAGAARVKPSTKATKPKPPAADGLLPFDDDEWEQELNPFQAPETEDKPSKLHSYDDPNKVSGKSLRWTKRGLQTLNAGLTIAGLCFLLQIVLGLLGLADKEGMKTLMAVIGGFYLFAALLMLIGPYFCITVPEKTGAKQMAIISSTAQTIAVVMGILFFYVVGQAAANGGKVEATEAIAFPALMFIASMVSYFSFVQFLKQLAEFIGDADTANSTATVLMIGVVEALCIVLAFVMPALASSLTQMAWLLTVSGLCYITAVLGGFIAAFMYVAAVQKLASSLPSR